MPPNQTLSPQKIEKEPDEKLDDTYKSLSPQKIEKEPDDTYKEGESYSHRKSDLIMNSSHKNKGSFLDNDKSKREKKGFCSYLC